MVILQTFILPKIYTYFHIGLSIYYVCKIFEFCDTSPLCMQRIMEMMSQHTLAYPPLHVSKYSQVMNAIIVMGTIIV